MKTLIEILGIIFRHKQTIEIVCFAQGFQGWVYQDATKKHKTSFRIKVNIENIPRPGDSIDLKPFIDSHNLYPMWGIRCNLIQGRSWHKDGDGLILQIIVTNKE